MTSTPNTGTRRTGVLISAIAALTLLAAACVPEASAPTTTSSTTTTTEAPAGPNVTVTPTTDLALGGDTVSVTGEGFNPAGSGIYVAFGPKGADYFTNAANYSTVIWVWANPSPSPGQAKLEADGSFSVNLDVVGTYTDGNGNSIDCTVDDCQILTFAAHGSADRSQDTFTSLTFG